MRQQQHDASRLPPSAAQQSPPATNGRRGPRLFDPTPDDPFDSASFFATLGHELKGLRDEEAVAARDARLHRVVWQVVALASTQALCALLMLASQIGAPTVDSALLLTAAVVLLSSSMGLAGGLRRSGMACHAFFLTQIWVLAAVFAQWLRSQNARARQAVYYEGEGTQTPQ